MFISLTKNNQYTPGFCFFFFLFFFAGVKVLEAFNLPVLLKIIILVLSILIERHQSTKKAGVGRAAVKSIKVVLGNKEHIKEPDENLMCALCTVYHGLFALHFGANGRLCSEVVAIPVHLLYYFL